MENPFFSPRLSISQVEGGCDFAPKFDSAGLMPVVTTDADSGRVLMVGYMNRTAVQKTIESGEAHYWSRSRQAIWHKGEVSGYVQKVVQLLVDDDQDALWMKARLTGGAASCHVGYRSCFYREIQPQEDSSAKLKFIENEKAFNPEEVYQGTPNPTKL